MEKLRADNIIKDFIKPIFGFSLNKTRRTEEAEELANRITIKVYEALLRKDDILDVESYIFKIAHNVWVNYVKEEVKGSKVIEIDSVSSPLFSDVSMEHKIIEDEDRHILRREIAYLSNVQRKIILLHYFENASVNEISIKLNLPTGTVKWHLSEARKDIKEGMVKVRKIGNLGINPIRFADMGHNGSPGNLGDTSYFLRRTITQNIAYAAYHEAKSINEIADELGVSPVFVEDEVSALEEYGFMDKAANNRYITNMIINEIDEEFVLKTHELDEKYAKIIGDHYCKAFFEMKEDFDSTGVYYPDNDFNFLLWSLIPYAIQSALYFKENEKIPYDEIMVPRKDGGNYAASATIIRIDKLPFDEKYYRCSGDMSRGSNNNVFGWQFNTYWSDRFGWEQFANREIELCYEFRNGLLHHDERNIDDYKFLIDKGYLTKENDQFKLNVVWCDNGEVHNNLLKVFPQASEELRTLLKDIDRESYELMRKSKPDHVDKICRVLTQNSATASLLRAHILKYLVDCNLLKEPKEHQRKSVTSIFGSRS